MKIAKNATIANCVTTRKTALIVTIVTDACFAIVVTSAKIVGVVSNAKNATIANGVTARKTAQSAEGAIFV